MPLRDQGSTRYHSVHPSGETGARGAARFRILFVCTGNLCRSPIAERLLRAGLGVRSPIVAESAGTGATPGRAMAPGVIDVLREEGADPEGFTARQLTAQLVCEADLILTATRAHRALAVSLHPRAATRAYTIVEFGVLAGAVPASEVGCQTDLVQRAHTLHARVHLRRGLVPVDQPDIPDPYGGSPRAFREVARQISGALAVPLELLAAEVTPPQAAPAGSPGPPGDP